MVEPEIVESSFLASASAGEVSSILVKPRTASALLVLAHGAGAGMRHRFMEGIAARLAERDVATLRYQFPYWEKGSRRPDPRPILTATVRSAIGAAREAAGDLPIFAGGKSMGGRMTSLAASEEASLAGVRGLVFFGFPLHAAGKPSRDRAEHLAGVRVPMLFLQGTRDALARIELIRPVCDDLGGLAELVVIEGADHGFAVGKRSGRSGDDVLDALASAVRDFMDRC